MNERREDEARLESAASESLLFDLTHLIESYLNSSMSSTGFVSRFFRIKEELDRASSHPAIDGLILSVEEDLPNTSDRDQWREDEKLRDLRDRVQSLNNFVDFCSPDIDAEWFPKHFIETRDRVFNYKYIEQKGEAVEIGLIDGSAIRLESQDIQRTYSIGMEDCHKGRPVSICAKTVTKALIEIRPLRRILVVPLTEIEDPHESESNQWWGS